MPNEKRSCFYSSFFHWKKDFPYRGCSFLISIRKEPKNRPGEALRSCSRKNRRPPRDPSRSALPSEHKMFQCGNGFPWRHQYKSYDPLLGMTILYLYCIAQKMPCFFHKDMLEFRLRKYGKNQFLWNENSGFFRKKGVTIYVFIRLCLG